MEIIYKITTPELNISFEVLKFFLDYTDDPTITSQGTIIFEENFDDYKRQIEEAELKKFK